MEGSEMLVDTSIFIEFLRAKDKTKTALYMIPDDAQIYTVKTLNKKHFDRIEGLNVV